MFEQTIAHVRWFARQLVGQFVSQGCMNNAASLTYTTLFAVVPFVTVAFTMFSVLPKYQDLGLELQSYVLTNFVPETGSVVQEKLLEFSDGAKNLGLTGLAMLVVTAFMMIVAVEKAFNAIWHVPEPRKGLQRFLLYWGVMTFGPPLVAIGAFVSAYLIELPFISGLETIGVTDALLNYVPMLTSGAAFTVLYYALPHCHVPFKHALAGGVATMVCFELAKWLFTYSVKRMDTELIYGTFAAVPFFLMWLYLVWVLVLTGAVFVRTLSLRPEVGGEPDEPELVKSVRVLGVIHSHHLDGRSVTDAEIDHAVPMSSVQRDRVFAVLRDLRLLIATEDERWTLGRSLKTVSLLDLFVAMPDIVDDAALAGIRDVPGAADRLARFSALGREHLSVSLDEVLNRSNGGVVAT